MKASEFAKVVTEMIKSEKEVIKDHIEREDWQGLEDEIFECAQSAD